MVSQNRKTITSESSFPVENHYGIVYSWLNKGLKGNAAQQKWPPPYSSKLKLAFCEVKWRPSVYGLLFFPQPCLFWTSRLQQETHLAGASERNSWKLNAMCPHEFLRAHSSYCVPNACDRNINRSADVLSWVLNLPARQRVVTCQHYEEQPTVTPEDIFTYNGISHWQERNLELSENMIPTLSQWLVSHSRKCDFNNVFGSSQHFNLLTYCKLTQWLLIVWSIKNKFQVSLQRNQDQKLNFSIRINNKL